MKKILFLLLMIFSLSLITACNKETEQTEPEDKTSESVSTPEEHTHSFDLWKFNADTHWRECSCGATNGEPVAHTGGKATCVAKAECSECGLAYGGYGSHSFTLYINDTACGAEGTETATCDNLGCLATDTREVTDAAKSHAYGKTWISDETKHWKECSCGATTTAVSHFGGVATATEKAKCVMCGTEYGSIVDHEHNYEKKWTSDGNSHWHACKICGAKDKETQHTVATEWSIDDKKHWHACTVCEAEIGAEAHTGGEATETSKAVCDICGNEYGKLLGQTMTFYYYDSKGWGGASFYHWFDINGSVVEVAGWPGSAMTPVDGYDNWYEIEIETNQDTLFEGLMLIFNYNGSQTKDLTYVGKQFYKYETPIDATTLDEADALIESTPDSDGSGSTGGGSISGDTETYALMIYPADGSDPYQITLVGVEEFDGYTQYFGDDVELNVGDVIKLYDKKNNAEWAIQVLDPYGQYEKFTASADGITCNVAGKYDFYVKFKFEDDKIYIGNESGA